MNHTGKSVPNTAPRKPPGLWPWGLPLLGAIRRDPLGAARAIQARYGDVAELKVLSTRLCYLFHPAAVRRVLVDRHDDFAKDERLLAIFRSVHGTNVLTTEGATWERQRRILAPAFTARRIAACAALMGEAAEEGIHAELPATAGGSAVIDVDRLTTRITMDVILRALFGYRAGHEESSAVSSAVRALTRQLMREFFWPLRPTPWLPYPGCREKERNLATVRGMIAARIEARRQAATTASPDILGMLLDARDAEATAADAGLSRQEILDNCVGLFGAGHDTSATALTWWIGLMAANPSIAARVREELHGLPGDRPPTSSEVGTLRFLQATIREAMRLYPPSTAMFSRRALRDVHMDDRVIARGTLVVIPIWSLHHDPRWFPQPDAFRPERFMPGAVEIPRSAFMPFGVGPHFCLGQQFAMVEMAIIAAMLVRRYDFSLDGAVTLPPPEVDVVLKPKERLRVRFARRGQAG